MSEREAVISKLKDIMGVEDDKLTWSLLCEYTYFDSFPTALAYGLNWKETDINLIPIGYLKMALLNIYNYPTKCSHCKAFKDGLCVASEPHKTVDFDFSCDNFKNPRVE